MKIRPATPKDIRNINVAPYFEGGGDWRSALGAEDAAGSLAQYARSVEIDSHLLAIFGIVPSVPGVAEIWTLLDDEAYEHPLAMALAVKRLMPIPWTEMNIHRLQATVECGTPVSERTITLLEHHGFQQEGVLRKYVRGKDFHLFSNVSPPTKVLH